MTNEKYLAFNTPNQDNLIQEIELLKKQLESIQTEIISFENILRTHLSDMIVEAQELLVLYKAIKKAKKAKRLEQKKRGKNYKESTGLQVTHKEKEKLFNSDEQKEKKRLYREAMLHVHPDKFHMSGRDTDVATEITTRLIEIYQNESLETLKAYHAYIFQGTAQMKLSDAAAAVKIDDKVNYLYQEKEHLEKDIALAKERHLYKVITEYDDPLSFVTELKAYYEDRIFKLRKRTRKGL